MSHPSRPSEGAPAELLFLGCEGSGKSGLVRRIQRAAVTAAQGAAAAAELDDVSFAAAPTNGVERDEIQWRGLRIALKEVGGAMKTTWNSYTQHCAAIIVRHTRTQRGNDSRGMASGHRAHCALAQSHLPDFFLSCLFSMCLMCPTLISWPNRCSSSHRCCTVRRSQPRH